MLRNSIAQAAGLLAVQAEPLLRQALCAAAVHAPAALQQARTCITYSRHWRLPQVPDAALPVVQSDDNKASAGEPPHSPYREIFGGLWQSGEPHHILFSDDHSNIQNEVEKLLLVAGEEGGAAAVFKVVEQFGRGPDWSGMNVATAFSCLAQQALRMSEAAVQRQILRHPCFSMLVGGASSRLASMTSAELAVMSRAFCTLRYDGSALVQPLH